MGRPRGLMGLTREADSGPGALKENEHGLTSRRCLYWRGPDAVYRRLWSASTRLPSLLFPSHPLSVSQNRSTFCHSHTQHMLQSSDPPVLIGAWTCQAKDIGKHAESGTETPSSFDAGDVYVLHFDRRVGRWHAQTPFRSFLLEQTHRILSSPSFRRSQFPQDRPERWLRGQLSMASGGSCDGEPGKTRLLAQVSPNCA